MDTRKLHRGKRKDNGEWVEGFYAEFQLGINSVPFIGASNSIGTMMWFEVYPETVGQCIGMTDIHGKNIFDGDVVKHYNHFPDEPGLYALGRIFWDGDTLRFRRTTDSGMNVAGIAAHCVYEVIGNIHEDYEWPGGTQ